MRLEDEYSNSILLFSRNGPSNQAISKGASKLSKLNLIKNILQLDAPQPSIYGFPLKPGQITSL